MQGNTWPNSGWGFLMKQCGLLWILNFVGEQARDKLIGYQNRAGRTRASLSCWLYVKYEQNPFNVRLFLHKFASAGETAAPKQVSRQRPTLKIVIFIFL